MRNTPEEIVEYTALIDKLENSLFAKLVAIRGLNDREDGGHFLGKRQQVIKYLSELQIARWHLNNSYGFDPRDGMSATLIKNIEAFVKCSPFENTSL